MSAVPLAAEELLAALRARGQHRFADALHVHDALDSTSARARQLAEAGAADGTLVVADRQTSGRGRQGRAWFSPPGRNLYATWLLRPAGLPLTHAPALSLGAAVALAQAIETTTGLRAKLKWPNDVLLNGRKCAGILPELATHAERVDYVLLGVGVNVNVERSTLDAALPGLATSLAAETGRTFSRSVLLAELCAELEPWLARLAHEGPAPLARAWKTRAAHLGSEVRVSLGPAQTTDGVAVDLDDFGALLIRDARGEVHRVCGGEVELLSS